MAWRRSPSDYPLSNGQSEPRSTRHSQSADLLTASGRLRRRDTMAAKHLFVANELGLFAALAQSPATLDELAQCIDIPRRTTSIVADAVLSLGLIAKQKDSTTAAFLGRGPAAGLVPASRHINRFSCPLWQNLEPAVRSGSGQSHWGSGRSRSNGSPLKASPPPRHQMPPPCRRLTISPAIAWSSISAAARARFSLRCSADIRSCGDAIRVACDRSRGASVPPFEVPRRGACRCHRRRLLPRPVA
jgi:hypothetical protein